MGENPAQQAETYAGIRVGTVFLDSQCSIIMVDTRRILICTSQRQTSPFGRRAAQGQFLLRRGVERRKLVTLGTIFRSQMRSAETKE